MPAAVDESSPTPSPFAYILSFLLVGLCWGFTTPFIRRAAVNYTAPNHPSITDPRRSWLSRQIAKAFFTVVGLLKSPGYAIPLLCNLTGSVWFFLLVGKAGTCTLGQVFFPVHFLRWRECFYIQSRVSRRFALKILIDSCLPVMIYDWNFITLLLELSRANKCSSFSLFTSSFSGSVAALETDLPFYAHF